MSALESLETGNGVVLAVLNVGEVCRKDQSLLELEVVVLLVEAVFLLLATLKERVQC